MATNTYVALDKVTVGTATPTITFSNISGSYTDLVIVGNWGQSVDSESCLFRVGNGSIDTGSNYSATEFYGTGSAAGSQKTSNATGARITFASGGGSAVTSNFQLNLMNYANTTTNKTFITRTNVPSSTYPGTSLFSSFWRSTAAINTVQLYLTGGNFLVGSTFSLYGIAAQPVATAKATGGTITYAVDGYTYHTFTSSGTFTPSQALSCDVLVVAGGGGGSSDDGGGGGAGGLLGFASQALTATGYTVTIGAGGAGGNATQASQGGNSQFGALTASVGGGWGSTTVSPAGTGGSGGGGGRGGGSIGGSATSGQGYAGGNGITNSGTGGGGGAGGAGASATSLLGAAGGVGSSAYSTWGLATNTGQNVSGTVYYAGGGAGGSNGSGTYPSGGFGGGGAGGPYTNPGNGVAGTANTGGGGGGGGGGYGVTTNGKAGGSGIVIIRYASV